VKNSLGKFPRILLCGVFGPYGVDDGYGRKENIMELFHNQVTKAQGLASLRLHHRTFGLYFIAANVHADVTVLDFPSKKRFMREIQGQYDLVGISFIAPNFSKAKEMCRLIRVHAPASTIVLGGHGAAIEGLKNLIDCDHVVCGDGISWLRSHLGQDPAAPVIHPVLPSNDYRRFLGVRLKGTTASLLAPGVGCPNACRFCSTSHFFGKQYVPFVHTGRDLFDLVCRISDQTGSDEFFVMDENFLKQKKRAWDLLRLMQAHQRWFRFSIFSSADTIMDFGIHNLVRLGVNLVWIGVESQSGPQFAKNVGIDFPALIQRLREHGIGVLTSGILCLEHHTSKNMQEDIDYIIGLKPDLIQFMLLTALPVTGLYHELKKDGTLRQDLPFEEWHGQKYLNFNHPQFTSEQAETWLKTAFAEDYRQNGSSIGRLMETAILGARTLSELAGREEAFRVRSIQILDLVRVYRPLLSALQSFAVNTRENKRLRELERACHDLLGPKTWKDKGLGLAAKSAATAWNWRIRLLGDRIQPRTLITRYGS